MGRAWAIAIGISIAGCTFGSQSDPPPPGLASDSDAPADDDGGGDDDATAEAGGDTGWGGTGGTDDGVGDTPGDAPGDASGAGDESGESGVMNDCPRARVSVSAGHALNVRPSPSTAEEPVGELPNNAVVDVLEETAGELVQGTDVWLHVATAELEGFVSGAFATCTFDEPPDLLPPDGFWLPLSCGTSATVSQGNFGSFSHQGNAAYAFDFSLGIGTPMVAIADGLVIHRYADTVPGDPCYDGGDASCYPYANLVTLLHGDGTTSIYKHLSEVLVSDGELVPRGSVVGLSGSTGYSTGPHAHVMRQEDCGEANCQSIPLEFEDVDGGVPETGDTVTSDNCP